MKVTVPVYRIRFKDTKRPVNGYFKHRREAFDELKTAKFAGVMKNFETYPTHRVIDE